LRPDLRKIWIVARTEFASAIRTRSFLIVVLLLPVLTGGSILLQLFVIKRVDTRPRTIAVIDRTGDLFSSLERAAQKYNAQTVNPQGEAILPKIQLTAIAANIRGEVEPIVLLELSEKVRRGELDAFVEIPRGAVELPGSAQATPMSLLYHSDHPNDDVLPKWLWAAVNDEIRSRRYRSSGIDQSIADRVNRSLTIDNLGLFERASPSSGGPPAIKTAQKVDPIRTAVVPGVLMFAMYFVIMTSSPQLLSSVLEEKMSKISEVLLGSIKPFELMMGKLLGNTAIALVVTSLYLGCGYSLAAYQGYGDVISPSLIVAFGVFLVVAVLLYGSLYMAVGAACTELKDAHTLMMPVMMLTMFPAFVWIAILKDPSSPLSVGLALFPPASPFLMLMRMAMQPAPPAWQVVLSIVLSTLTALFCVWAAAKIFRTGLLMQGKSPTYRELSRWVLAR
jgi:ABC-2 type transport system permease protein